MSKDNKNEKQKFERTLKLSKTIDSGDKKVSTELLLVKDREGNLKLTKTIMSDSVVEANYRKLNFFTKDENVDVLYNLISNCFDNAQKIEIVQFKPKENK